MAYYKHLSERTSLSLLSRFGEVVGSPMFRKPVPIEEFPQHVKQLHANVDQGMEDEFQVRIGSSGQHEGMQLFCWKFTL